MRIEDHKRFISLGCVLIAFLLKIQIAEIAIDHVAVVRAAATVEETVNRLSTLQIRKTDTQHTKCVFDELLL